MQVFVHTDCLKAAFPGEQEEPGGAAAFPAAAVQAAPALPSGRTKGRKLILLGLKHHRSGRKWIFEEIPDHVRAASAYRVHLPAAVASFRHLEGIQGVFPAVYNPVYFHRDFALEVPVVFVETARMDYHAVAPYDAADREKQAEQKADR